VPDLLLQHNAEAALPVADLYIWDCDVTSRIPSALLDSGNGAHQLLLLVNSKRTPSLDTGFADQNCVLLKPISPFTVRAFLELSEKAWQLSRATKRTHDLHSDRQALVEYVLAANLRLQEYDHHRTNFLARALHDLRAPLTALSGYCGLLADGQLGPVSAEQRDLFSRMQSSARRISKQAAGIFELTVLGQVRRQPQWALSDIEEVVAQAVDEVFLLSQDKNQNISLSLSAPDKPFHFDPEQIGQVILNLLENSCKFTPCRGSVEIRGYNVLCDLTCESAAQGAIPNENDSTAYRIDIEDSGAGIESDLVACMFEQDTSYSAGRDRSGGGLGLAISKMIVSAHQGFIWADNSQQGAVFSVVLPFQPFSMQSSGSEGPEHLRFATY
jgi:signal transduction histidine kinase